MIWNVLFRSVNNNMLKLSMIWNVLSHMNTAKHVLEFSRLEDHVTFNISLKFTETRFEI